MKHIDSIDSIDNIDSSDSNDSSYCIDSNDIIDIIDSYDRSNNIHRLTFAGTSPLTGRLGPGAASLQTKNSPFQ